MLVEIYPDPSPDATVPHPGHDRGDVLLDAKSSKIWLPDSVRTRRKASDFAHRYAEVLRAFGTNFSDWGTGTDDGPRYATTAEKWNDWKTKGRCEENAHLPYYQVAPQHLPIRRLDNHLRQGRTPYEKLYVTPGGLNGLALGMLDSDAHHGETDAKEAYRALAEQFFDGNPYDEPSGQERVTPGHHGYIVVDYRGTSVAELNHRMLLASRAAGDWGRARGFQATLEIKLRVTEFDHKQCITKRGALFALPNLPEGEDSLARFAGSAIIVGLERSNRLIREGERLTSRVVVAVPDRSDRPKVAPKKSNRKRRADGRFVPTETDPFHLRREAAQWKSRQLGRPATKTEALDVYNPLRPDDACDSVRERKMQQAVELVARTFDARKCRRRCSVGTWEENRERCVALVEQFVTDDAYARANIPPERRCIPAVDLAKALYSLEVKSFTKEPDAKDQFTWGLAYIDGTVKNITGGEGMRKQTRSDARHVLAACELAECFDPDYFATWGNLRGRSQKYHVGPASPDYAKFCRWAEDNQIETVKIRDLPEDEKPPQGRRREDITHWVPKPFPKEKRTSEKQRDSDMHVPAPAVAVSIGGSIRGWPE